MKTIIPINLWTLRVKEHEDKVTPFAEAFLKRRSLHLKHTVHDFLFTYYTFSPLKLKNWVPSFEEEIEMNSEMLSCYPWLKCEGFWFNGSTLRLNKEKLTKNILGLNLFIKELCSHILKRPSRFNCFGLHEWAMVYKMSKKEIRHQEQALRVSIETLNTFVESQNICCSHYDAYRFFTKDAKGLNVLNPCIETRLEMEQGGCLHANMDLYKWAAKLMPWIGSDFLGKAFLLAVEGRELDMRASPYDLKNEGFSPICIETESGRKEYIKQQQQLAEKAEVLRKELLKVCIQLSEL